MAAYALISENVPLGPLTTLGLGGTARFFLRADSDAGLIEGFHLARQRGLQAVVLGGGSNVVIGDGGFDGLVIQIGTSGVQFEQNPATGAVEVEAAAGEPWDAFVAATVARGLAGLECLSGIPGLVGATPIQNVGAYGQEVCETIVGVRVYDRRDDRTLDLAPDRCEFAYRDSAFRRNPDRFAVLSVRFRLQPGGPPAVRYAELQRRLADDPAPDLARVRNTVIELRRAKSMVIDPADENRRSVGSFFTNPILTEADARAVVDRAIAAGVAAQSSDVPQFAATPGHIKLAAGWLIEHAGIHKGLRAGNVGISTRHALALVHHGGGTTAELLQLARQVRAAVAQRFGVTLSPEPVFIAATL